MSSGHNWEVGDLAITLGPKWGGEIVEIVSLTTDNKNGDCEIHSPLHWTPRHGHIWSIKFRQLRPLGGGEDVSADELRKKVPWSTLIDIWQPKDPVTVPVEVEVEQA